MIPDVTLNVLSLGLFLVAAFWLGLNLGTRR